MSEGLGLNLSTTSVPVTLADGILILVASGLAGLIIRYLFYKYANSMSSRSSFGNTILLVTISVSALIAVVKSSLALSLGLVGALSVIRFRTAVKEPYNLSFILLSISVAIAIGASQFTFAIITLIFATLTFIFLSKYGKNFINHKKVDDLDTISIDLTNEAYVDGVCEIFNENDIKFNLKSLTRNKNGNFSLIIRTSIPEIRKLDLIIKSINEKYGDCEFAFYESPNG